MRDNIRNFSFNLYNDDSVQTDIQERNSRDNVSITENDLTQYSPEDFVLFRTILTNMIMSNPEMSLEVEKKYKHVISDEGKKKLRTLKYENELCNPSCPIYYVDFEIGQEITILPCNHGFCSEAINQWLSDEKAECPVCRMAFDSIEVKVKKDDPFINGELISINEEPVPDKSDEDEDDEEYEDDEDEDDEYEDEDDERLTIHDNSPENETNLNTNQRGILSSIWNLFSQSQNNDIEFQRAIMESYEQV